MEPHSEALTDKTVAKTATHLPGLRTQLGIENLNIKRLRGTSTPETGARTSRSLRPGVHSNSLDFHQKYQAHQKVTQLPQASVDRAIQNLLTGQKLAAVE